MRELRLGRAAGLDLSASLSAVLASLAALALLWAAGLRLLGLDAAASVFFALVAGALHWTFAMAHHLGHAWAARRVGYPMTGIRLWALWGMDLYPADEPPLPAAIHIRRAVAGPLTSLALMIVFGVMTLAVRPLDGMISLLTAWCWLDNLILTVAGLLPVGFTDADTLLYWWPRR